MRDPRLHQPSPHRHAGRRVRGLCQGKKLPFEEHGKVVLPGFDEPVALFEVDWREAV
jgi:hypothetical protein